MDNINLPTNGDEIKADEITEFNYQQFEEIVAAAATSVKCLKKANEDGSINWKDFMVLYPMAPSISKAVADAQAALPVLNSILPEVIAKREEIIVRVLQLTVLTPEINVLVNQTLNHMIASYAGIKALVEARS